MPGNDAFLWYNTPGWDKYGLAVPNWSDDTHSQNESVRDLVDAVGRNLFAIMWLPDVRMRTPPTINTLKKIHKLCLRARQILNGRAVAPGTVRMESTHTLPAPEVFRVYPTPYFNVRNRWLKQYCGLMLQALSEAMQDTENAYPLEITTTFAGRIGQYITRVYQMLGSELLMLPTETVKAANFTLTDDQLAAYDPTKWFTATEMVDTVPDLFSWPTEDDLSPISDGLPVTQLNNLPRWPDSGQPTSTNSSSQTEQAAAPSGNWPTPPSP